MAEVEVVRCRDVSGRLRKLELIDQGEFATPGSALSQRLVVGNDVPLVRKFVPRAAGDRNPRYYDLLDNEIRAGTRLGQFLGRRYPVQLARLVAYNVDVEEPFVLLNTYVGEPAAPDRFDDRQRRQFQIGLLRALQAAGAAGVVHGALSLNALRWDGAQPQLVDFESAQRVGDPRRGAGTGVVDPRDDLYAAALLIRQVALNATAEPAPDRTRDPELLRALLDPILAGPIEHWPMPADLLSRLRAQAPPFMVSDPEAALAEGYARFEQVCARKRGQHVAGMAAPAQARRWRLPFLTTMLLTCAAVAGMVAE